MGLTIRLQDEQGELIREQYDPQQLLNRYLPPLSDESYHCLRFIDDYGDTYFNRPQIKTFLAEWDRVLAEVKEKEVKDLFLQIRALAEHVDREVHLYLKFVGD